MVVWKNLVPLFTLSIYQLLRMGSFYTLIFLYFSLVKHDILLVYSIDSGQSDQAGKLTGIL